MLSAVVFFAEQNYFHQNMKQALEITSVISVYEIKQRGNMLFSCYYWDLQLLFLLSFQHEN